MGDNADLSAANSKSIASIEDIARAAVLTESHPDLEHNNEFVSMIHRFYSAAMIDGVLYRVKLTVKDFIGHPPKKELHALASIEIENAPLGTVPVYETDKPSKSQAQPTTGRTITITELLKNATLNDGTPIIPK